MTTAEFKAARKSLGLTGEAMAKALGLGKHGVRTIQRIEAGDLITGPMAHAVNNLLRDKFCGNCAGRMSMEERA